VTFIPTNQIRLQFTQAISEMYQREVPLYKTLLSIADKVNQQTIKNSSELSSAETNLLNLEHHGAIRVASAEELSMLRRLFAVMGMYPVDYYDLSIAGIPVHSTAFRALDKDDLAISPFRMFCSLLRLDLIKDQALRKKAIKIINKRNIFTEELLKLIESSEKQGGLNEKQTESLIKNSLEVFRWYQRATVDKASYDELKEAHGLIADILSFRGPHINHLTPKILDIDECQKQLNQNNIKVKANVEGPPKRNCPILLRQTSFLAIAEDVTFKDGKNASHTARFGEVEQRGIALTPKGRDLYDKYLSKARNLSKDIDYSVRLKSAFADFPDDYDEIRKQGLAYFTYSFKQDVKKNKIKENVDIEEMINQGLIETSPITYEDFLPVSAAGIFVSNLAKDANSTQTLVSDSNKAKVQNHEEFVKALGVRPANSFRLYEKMQQDSLDKIRSLLAKD